MQKKVTSRREWERRRAALEWQLAQLRQRPAGRARGFEEPAGSGDGDHDDDAASARMPHEADVEDGAEWRTRSMHASALGTAEAALRGHLALAPPDPYGGEAWAALSARLRTAAGFCCRVCEADFADHPALLHVHHRDRNKRNNAPDNLVVVCVLCHAEAPEHAHLLQRLSRETLDRLHAAWRVPYRKRRLDLLVPPVW